MEIEENNIEFECPECGCKIIVKGCRTCEYEEAKVCWDCGMFHKNYKPKNKK